MKQPGLSFADSLLRAKYNPDAEEEAAPPRDAVREQLPTTFQEAQRVQCGEVADDRGIYARQVGRAARGEILRGTSDMESRAASSAEKTAASSSWATDLATHREEAKTARLEQKTTASQTRREARLVFVQSRKDVGRARERLYRK